MVNYLTIALLLIVIVSGNHAQEVKRQIGRGRGNPRERQLVNRIRELQGRVREEQLGRLRTLQQNQQLLVTQARANAQTLAQQQSLNRGFGRPGFGANNFGQRPNGFGGLNQRPMGGGAFGQRPMNPALFGGQSPMGFGGMNNFG
ncbi:hypothetical protein WR25_16293 [Diploscapter pachys]|uniref:SXP/RAL-2 family protein Ani s 5-like cation-binding domain-containing protein n=1 Tax=Diploscapter pachys TaxID=2018661 RepID=A0A2A2KIS6_9BILA|nr:hypothetical protein WR25_16293 [Diploscapter pachys]